MGVAGEGVADTLGSVLLEVARGEGRQLCHRWLQVRHVRMLCGSATRLEK